MSTVWPFKRSQSKPAAPSGLGAAGEETGYARYNTSARPGEYDVMTRRRLEQFVGGYYASSNLSSMFDKARVSVGDEAGHVRLEYWNPNTSSEQEKQQRGDIGATIEDAMQAFKKGKGEKVKAGKMIGPSWVSYGRHSDTEALDLEDGWTNNAQTSHWFKVILKLPPGWEKSESVLFEWDSSGEAMIFDANGAVIQGLTGGFGNDRRAMVDVPIHLGPEVVGYIEASAHPRGGINDVDPPNPDAYFELKTCDILLPNLEARALAADFEVLVDLAETLPRTSRLANLARQTASDIMDIFRPDDQDTVAKGRKIAERVLGQTWEHEVEWDKLKDEKDEEGAAWVMGQCHIDTAWLWPWVVTKKKVPRSWSTQINSFAKYPESHFIASSAQHYAWLEQYYPETFDRLVQASKKGRFEPIGGAWLEHDANLPSGESFCRQFLLGQRFFKSRFGKYCTIAMLPDTFGYSGSLPQIARLSGCDSFFNQKISWNLYNEFPNTTFNWVGIDGTQLLTHQTPAVNFNSQVFLSDVLKNVTNHKNSNVSPTAMFLFGHGDGGGGPTREMHERVRRWKAISEVQDARGAELPKLKLGGSMRGMFDQIRKETHQGHKLPSWEGELYLEIHRGTYTSQAATKRNNRKGECLMRELETALTCLSLGKQNNYTYPFKVINQLWEALCLCQFHDTLPGSVIRLVQDDLDAKYAWFFETAKALLADAAAHLASRRLVLGSRANEATSPLINPLPMQARMEVVEVPKELPIPGVEEGWELGERNKAAHQASKDGQNNYVFARCVEGECGGDLRTDIDYHEVAVHDNAEGLVLRSKTHSLTVKDGRITSLKDILLDRELLAPGTTAGLVVYEDRPADWDAWDVDEEHLRMGEYISFDSCEVAESGPLLGSMACTFKFGKSSGRLVISQQAAPHIEATSASYAPSPFTFELEIDWQEKHRFLKFELPTVIKSPYATYDHAFGTVQRPTHRNTRWDQAKFEVPCHMFADLSEWGYGVAVVNDSKYGFAVQGGTMRLSLLRAPTRPDPDCDTGKHEIRWGVYPHQGGYGEVNVRAVAEAFNHPLRLAGTDTPAYRFPFVVEGAKNVVLHTVKRGEDDANSKEKTVILRLYEHLGGHGSVSIKARGLKVRAVALVNIIEDELDAIKLDKGSDGDCAFSVEFKPFEIKTVKLVLA